MTHPPASARRARGFTLVEVMVALAVVAITLGAGLKAAGALTDNAARLTDTMAAQWCADNQLALLTLTRQFPPVGDGEFLCEQAGQTYRGVLVVRPTPNPNFRRVDARMFDPRERPLLTLSTVLGRY